LLSFVRIFFTPKGIVSEDSKLVSTGVCRLLVTDFLASSEKLFKFFNKSSGFTKSGVLTTNLSTSGNLGRRSFIKSSSVISENSSASLLDSLAFFLATKYASFSL